MTRPANRQTEWARLLVETLADAGVAHLVVSPGSRSTPILLAARRCGRLTLHDVIDERAASFFALGGARASGEVVALLCTSGTAPSHYLPAVIEARASGHPLVILSADRPKRLVDAGANQTIDQTALFGRHVAYECDLGDRAAQ